MKNKRDLEGKELDLLNGDLGFDIETSLFGFRKKWRVRCFSLGLMDMQSRLFHKIVMDEGFFGYEEIREIVGAQYTAVRDNAKVCAEIVAISALGKRWKIRLFKGLLKSHFYWNIDSKKLFDFADKIYKVNNYQDFMTSIALMSVKKTTATADTIEDFTAPTE